MKGAGVSVVLPVFAKEISRTFLSELDRAVRSVLSQEVSCPLELLVVDDGSPVPINTVESGKKILGDQRIKYFRLTRNSRLVFALNAGLRLARNPLIARIDHDDAWRPGKLAKQLALFEADPDLTIVGTGMRIVHSDETKDHDIVRKGGWQGVLETFAEIGCPFPHGSIVARREVFELLGGYPHDPELAHCEDFALWGDWVRFFKPDFIREVLFDYTVSDSQVSAKHAASQRMGSGLVHGKFLKLGVGSNLPAAFAKMAAILEKPVYEVGKAVFLAWKYFDTILADPDLVTSLRVVLPDREVLPIEEAGNTLAERFFVLSRHTTPEIAHARLTLGKEVLSVLL